MIYSNIILFVNNVSQMVKDSVIELEKTTGVSYTIAVIADTNSYKKIQAKGSIADLVIPCNFSSSVAIEAALLPYKDAIIGTTCFGEKNISSFKRIVPHLPYVISPTAKSLGWATNKIMMRQLFAARNKKITPKFTVITDASEEAILSIKKRVGYPLVLKPASLASSQLVTKCYHEDEIRQTLKKMFKRIEKFYKIERPEYEEIKTEVLVESFMDGEMYSIDAYVDAFGEIYFCPFVHVKTGAHIGFEDFFNYYRITPTTLSKENIEKGHYVTEEAIYALNLRNTTVHVELMKTDNGWKVIELGPRVGGFRHLMYELSYGINHILNDILVHMGKKPKISKKVKGHTCVLKFYGKTEGVLKKIEGVRKINKLASFKEVKTHLLIGGDCRFAKNGGKGVVDVVLFNPDRSHLLADVRRVEKILKITIATNKK